MPGKNTKMATVSQKILFVDDDANVLNGLKRRFRKKFDVFIANSGPAGLEALEQHGPFAVVVADYNMPGMNGIEFLQNVHSTSPDTVRIMLTGRPGFDIAVSALNEGHIFRFLEKPCPSELLDKTLIHGLEQYRLVMSERILTTEVQERNAELWTLNAGLEKRVTQRTADLLRLHRFSTDLNSLDTLEGVAQLVVTTTAEMLQSKRVSIMLPDRDREYLRMVAATGVSPEISNRIRVPIGTAIAGRVFAQEQSIVANDPADIQRHSNRYEADFFASMPLVSSLVTTPSGVIGVLNVTEHHDGRPYNAEELNAIRAITESAAIALRNQIRRQELDETRDAIMLALAKLAEHRDPETGAHIERVQEYCRLLCETLATMPKYADVIDRAFIENIVRSSPLHDIGKVGVPDHILLKPGKLTHEEFEIMKQHVHIGSNTIKALIQKGQSQAFLEMGMQIALSHHEKSNGQGYPYGLKGEEIPLPARIMAVADVYDALTSERVYKTAMPHEQATSIIIKEAGVHFDPDVVTAFRHRERQFRKLVIELANDSKGL